MEAEARRAYSETPDCTVSLARLDAGAAAAYYLERTGACAAIPKAQREAAYDALLRAFEGSELSNDPAERENELDAIIDRAVADAAALLPIESTPAFTAATGAAGSRARTSRAQAGGS